MIKLARALGLFAGHAALTLRRIGHDQKRIWTYPHRVGSHATLPLALGTVGATALLIALDPHTTPHWQHPGFQEHPLIRRLNRLLSGKNMAIVINAAPAALFFGGLFQGNQYLRETGLLAGEAAASAEILATTMKHIDRRRRPIDIELKGDYCRTWFQTERRDPGGTGCFPSGHTASSFAVATIIAERYPKYRWLAFGSAGTIAGSRLHSRAHFPSDVFFGAALGFSISHYVVMRRPLVRTSEDRPASRPAAQSEE